MLELLAQRVLVRGFGDPGSPQEVGDEEKDQDSETDQHPAHSAKQAACRARRRGSWGRVPALACSAHDRFLMNRYLLMIDIGGLFSQCRVGSFGMERLVHSRAVRRWRARVGRLASRHASRRQVRL
jgi:hypothetical protein